VAQKPVSPAFKIISDTAAYTILPDSNWQLMSDVSGKLDLNEIINSKHFQNENLKINYKINVYWQRFKIINFLSTETKIAFPEVSFRADLFTRINNGEWKNCTPGSVYHGANEMV